jgi:hypothetical protein
MTRRREYPPRADGVWRSIDGHEIYHHKKAAGALYQAALRAELTQRLGVVFDPVNAHGQAEIAGFPPELTARWSPSRVSRPSRRPVK